MIQIKTNTQVSAGGVAFRERGSKTEIALISVGEDHRWQLPKGRVDAGESNETAAVREVREESGVETSLIGLIDTIDYWFYVRNKNGRSRIHKFVHFFLVRYESGDINNHDYEVNEARWFDIDEAVEQLAFESEKDIVRKAKSMIAGLHQRQ